MKRLNEEEIKAFIDFMIEDAYKVIGTKKKGIEFVFDELTKAEDFTTDYLPTILPLKKYFMPPKEILFDYEKKQQTMDITTPKHNGWTVYIGLRECDLTSLRFLDEMMLTKEADYYYQQRREQSMFFVFDCQHPLDDHCFCYMLHEKDTTIADAVFYSLEEGYALDLRSEESKILFGKFLQQHFLEEEDVVVEQRPLAEEPLALKKAEAFSDMKRVEAVCQVEANNCFSCGTCTAVCPTCYCFSISDEDNINAEFGQRVRTWDGCMLEDFSLVAGGHRLVSVGVERAIHRFNRKYKNAYKSHKAFICVGCGRCTRTCPAGNSMKDMTIKILEADNHE